ncbi:hypothetical protein TNIN_487621 [Trichonephila inaurata madagascariensis]|uniref:Endonuclease/exonuclease/phosphatase domain-containing protein n=1 Tax=Trichonephila inaurata madagascariensis TaxID=2747483 RepID=A0A8X6XAN6_9ARAC|nr:hypothetical protein TNIN_487621 [Trichonephila inaurata madagascariensis]
MAKPTIAEVGAHLQIHDDPGLGPSPFLSSKENVLIKKKFQKKPDAIFLGDLNAKHRSWGCTASNTRGHDLLNVADDKAPISLNDGSPSHTSFSYCTSEALDVSLVSLGLFPQCDWTALDSILAVITCPF